MKLPVSRAFMIRTVVAMVIIGSITAGSYILQQRHITAKEAPRRQIAALRAAINESLLVGSSFNSVPAGDLRSNEALIALRTNFTASHDNLTKALNGASHNIDDQTKKSTQAILDAQTQAMTDYDRRLTAVAKVLAYDPATDLGKVDLADTDTLIGHAQATSQALNVVSSKIGDQDLKAALTNETTCLNSLIEQLRSKSPATGTTRSNCIKQYATVRKQSGMFVAVVMTDYAKAISPQATSLLASLAQRLN